MKKDLVAAELSPDETERRVIRVASEDESCFRISMNSTCYVAGVSRGNTKSTTPTSHSLRKIDLWMSQNILKKVANALWIPLNITLLGAKIVLTTGKFDAFCRVNWAVSR